LIVYIASYPRSGNFWMQTLLGNQFKRPTTRMSSRHTREKTLQQWIAQNKKYYDIHVFDMNEDKSSDGAELSSWMTRYTYSGTDEVHQALLPGCEKLVKEPAIRETLAKDKEYYFLKTHFLPYSDYYDGEFVIQVVRNTGASLWSYYNYKKDLQDYNGTLSDVILGKSAGRWRDWTTYHKKWLDATKRLGSHYLQVRYEDLFNREIEFCERIQTFLGLPIISTELRTFEFYHNIRPALTRKGKATGWEENFSREQIELLWNTHGAMMTHFGYQEPLSV